LLLWVRYGGAAGSAAAHRPADRAFDSSRHRSLLLRIAHATGAPPCARPIMFSSRLHCGRALACGAILARYDSVRKCA